MLCCFFFKCLVYFHCLISSALYFIQTAHSDVLYFTLLTQTEAMGENKRDGTFRGRSKLCAADRTVLMILQLSSCNASIQRKQTNISSNISFLSSKLCKMLPSKSKKCLGKEAQQYDQQKNRAFETLPSVLWPFSQFSQSFYNGFSVTYQGQSS